jgi:hypothetical protein
VLPPRDATLSSCRALSFECAGTARIGPITVKRQPVLLVRIAMLQFLTRRAAIDIFIDQINKLPKRPSDLAPEVIGLGSVTVTPVRSQARISSPSK